jgi:hypothetical protein
MPGLTEVVNSLAKQKIEADLERFTKLRPEEALAVARSEVWPDRPDLCFEASDQVDKLARKKIETDTDRFPVHMRDTYAARIESRLEVYREYPILHEALQAEHRAYQERPDDFLRGGLWGAVTEQALWKIECEPERFIQVEDVYDRDGYDRVAAARAEVYMECPDLCANVPEYNANLFEEPEEWLEDHVERFKENMKYPEEVEHVVAQAAWLQVTYGAELKILRERERFGEITDPLERLAAARAEVLDENRVLRDFVGRCALSCRC